jgi:hypothetical protein
MAYWTRESRQPKHHFCFSHTCLVEFCTIFSLNSSIHFNDDIDPRFGLRDAQDCDGSRCSWHSRRTTHKSKKHVKDRNRAGRASMVPPSLDPPSKHARHDFAEGAPQSVPRPVPSTKGTTGESTTVPMMVPMMTPTTTHSTASHTDASRLTTKADALRNTRPSCTVIIHQARADPVSTCLPGVSMPRSWTLSRMSTPFRTSSDASLTK